ncbi:MAG: efflux RND transporter periplasmic adaptor subunit [Syntrophales bacterium]|nr:efflux RND transporter periplasmic adaptor subunit [Syntrophales bacterium]
MMIQNRNITKKGLLAAILIVFVIAFLTAGCGKKEAPQEGKSTTVEAEKRESGNEEEHKKEEPGVVTLSQEKQKSSGIEVQQVAMGAVAVPLSATAVIEMNMDRVAKISSRVTGKAVRIIASQGDRVKAGQPLAYLDSVELDQIWAEYYKAQGKVGLARKNLQREETLFQKKISPEKDLLKARQELGESEADLNLAQERFRLVGVDVAQFESSRGKGNHLLIPVTSPVGGVVIEKAVTQGEVVNPEKTLFMVADLSTLWVVIDVYEKDISRLRVGTGVKVSVTTFPDKVFKGNISYVADVVDEKTRTEKARVTIGNASGLLKPGMFATVGIVFDKTEKTLVVPTSAVQREGEKTIVFVARDESTFEKRVVAIGPEVSGYHQALSGLKEGDKVVTKGAFILKSETMKGLMKED